MGRKSWSTMSEDVTRRSVAAWDSEWLPTSCPSRIAGLELGERFVQQVGFATHPAEGPARERDQLVSGSRIVGCFELAHRGV